MFGQSFLKQIVRKGQIISETGCDGGFPYLIGGKYAEDFGLVLESENPYTGKDGQCITPSSAARFYSTEYEYVGGYYGA